MGAADKRAEGILQQMFDEPAAKSGLNVTAHLSGSKHVLHYAANDAVQQAFCIVRIHMKMWQLDIFTPELQPS